METEIYYTRASHLLEEGQTKDAYAAFLSIVELSIQQLHRVKFVHQTIVSKPTHYEDSITVLRSSIDQLEKIAVQTSSLPGAIKPNHPATATTQTKSPPPLPPKPATIQKPAVPPKPRIIPMIDTTTITQTITANNTLSPPTLTRTIVAATEANHNSQHHLTKSPDHTQIKSKRGRGSSVSFADHATTITPIQADNDEIQEEDVNNDGINIDDDDDDDDDDVVIEFDNVKPSGITRAFSFAGSSENGSILQSSPRQRARSKSWMVPGDSVEKSTIDVLSETIVNPWNLVPAQTNTGDSLAIPNSSHVTDYVPNIPAPPLLATHRKLQHRLNELEAALEQNKENKKQNDNSTENSTNYHSNQYHRFNQHQQKQQQQQELEFLILEQSHSAVALRDVLNKVRTLYMSAMTIPSILQFPPHLTAYQLSLIESSIFKDIPADALLSHSARTPHKKVAASTDFFNFITRSIEHSILLPQEPTKRAEIVNRWIKIGTKLLALNNYQTLKAIVSALGTPPVQRLRRTWECIPKKRIGRLELLTTLMSETDNYRRYREHMCLEKKQLWSKPVVPFLGVFIHDITYLYAAAKGKKDDSRVQDVLSDMRLSQRAPGYPQRPPASYLNNNKKQHIFRSMAITNALHFGNSKNNNSNRFTTSALMGEDHQEETELELEQQLIIQYLLMRPWVSEKTIDALSTLREPPKPRSVSSPTSSIYGRPSTISSPSSLTITTGVNLYNNINTNNNVVNNSNNNSNINSNNGSLLSNASSFIRFSNGNSSNNNSSSIGFDGHSNVSPTTATPVSGAGEESKRSLGGFWPFRKSTEMNRSSVSTDHSTPPPGPSWSDEDDEDDDDEDDSPSPPPPPTSFNHNSNLVMRRPQKQYSELNSSTRKRVFGHNRSVSLPSAKSFGISDLYSK